MKERFLTVLVPIKDSDVTQTYQTLSALIANVTPSLDNINNIYAVGAPVFGYVRTWLNPATNQYEFHQVVDREFPYLGKPLEIFDFTYDATRMGPAPTITAQGIMWYADKDSSGNDVTLEGLWTQECHVSFNGENFYLKQIPTSSKSNEDARYKYDIDFVSERVVLERVYLYDVVQPFVSSKPISESAQFSFYGDITELAKRINASLLRSGLATIALRSGVTPGSYLTYEEFNSVGLGTYTGTKDTSDPYPIVPGEMQTYIHYPHANIYEHFGGNYTLYLLNRVYLVDNPVSYHVGPSDSGYDVITDGDPRLSGYKCLIGKDKKGVMTTSEEKLITFENNTIHEALQQFHDTFELQYYIYRDTDSNGDFTGDTIIMVADCQHDFADWDATAASGEGDYTRDSDGIPTTTHPFDYGVEDALLSKEKTNTTDKIITRITGVGSEENIPWYYPNPNADGWIKPLYKRAGVEQSVTVDYPLSEGTTVPSSVRYEKYLKCRIGNIFKFGIIKKTKTTEDYQRSLNGWFYENNVWKGVVTSYVISTKTDIASPKMTIKLPALPSESNCTKIIARLVEAPNTQVGIFDSSETYDDPTDFQVAMLNRDESSYVSLTTNKIYYLYIYYYLSSKPNSRLYDVAGYRHPAQTIPDNEHENHMDPSGTQYHNYTRFRGVAYIGCNFYEQENLQEYHVWLDSPQNIEYAQGNAYHHVVCVESGYSLNGTSAQKVNPISRLSGRKYKDLSTGIIYSCSTSNNNDPTTGSNQNPFTANAKMEYKEWISTFINLRVCVYEAQDWYIGYKKVNLSDYGINGLTQGGSTFIPDIYDTIEFQRTKYVTPQPRLMPELYIKTDGERRFYNAHNYYVNGSLLNGTADPMIGEVQSGSKVKNPLYKENESDADSKHYNFENENVQIMPHEHIEEFEDVKPTIKEQQSYVRVYPTEDDFLADPESFYKKISGQYTQCSSSSIYSSTTAYYQLVRIDIVEEFAFDALDNNEIWEDNSEEGGAGEYKHPHFFAKLRPLGFNIFDLALQDDMILSMTTGHCGACNFRIAVDENTKKNPVQIWEYDVYKKNSNGTYSETPYKAGDLRRYIDTTDFYYKIGNDYFDVHSHSQNTVGFLVPSVYSSNQYRVADFDEEDVANGLVGSMKNKSKIVFAGDVVSRGHFIDSQQDTSENFVWIALYKDTETYGVIMPSAQPDYGDGNYSHYIDPKGSIYTDRKTGVTESLDDDEADKFVLVNIRLPQVYLRRAERDLARKIIAYMYDNNFQKFNFSIKFSRIFLAENDNIESNLNENSVLYVTFNNKIYRQYAKHYTYRMVHDAALPEISIELNDELSVSRTSIEQQAALQAQANVRNRRRWQNDIIEVRRDIERTALSRYDDSLLSGTIVSRDSKTSFRKLNKESKLYSEQIFDTQVDVEVNHFKKVDFELFNGTDLRIGNDIYLPTSFKRGGRIIKRRWDATSGTFVEDNNETFAPAFIDKSATFRKLVDYGYVAVSGASAPTFAANTYYKLENGVYTLLTEEPSDWSTAWTSYYKEATREQMKIDEFVNTVNTFNTGIRNNMLQVQHTVESRLVPYANGVTHDTSHGSCKPAYYYEVSGRDYVEQFWLDSYGFPKLAGGTEGTCTTSEGLSVQGWTNFNIG